MTYPGGLMSLMLSNKASISTDTGWITVGTGADDASYGTETWSNPGNITADDGVYASAPTAGSASSHYLKGTNLSLSVPAGATIDGIEVRFEAKTNGNGSIDRVRIVKGGTIGATDRTDSASLTTVDALYTYGSLSDLWGETWTSTDVNNSTFGFVQALVIGNGDTVDCDVFQVKVHYTT